MEEDIFVAAGSLFHYRPITTAHSIIKCDINIFSILHPSIRLLGWYLRTQPHS